MDGDDDDDDALLVQCMNDARDMTTDNSVSSTETQDWNDDQQLHEQRSICRLHTKVKRALLLDVVIRERPTVLQLLPSEDEALLVRRDTLLVLDLRLHVINRVGRLDLQRNGLAGERLHEDLHATTETEHCNSKSTYNSNL